MADKKISALTGATTPLAGTEVLPIVQSGTTVKVSVANLTAGRPISASSVNISGLTASTALALDASKEVVSVTNTGTGDNVLATSPTFITPILGVASATSLNKVALTAPATNATLTIAEGKTLTVNNSLTIAGTDATTMTFPTTSATLARTDAANSFTGDQTIAGDVLPQSVVPTSAPSSKWAIDGTNAGLLITIADTATYDLAVGSGIVYLWDNGGNGVGISYTFYGTAALQFNPSAFYSNTVGTAAKVNFYYNAGTNTYRLENLTGSSKSIYVVTLRLRAAS